MTIKHRIAATFFAGLLLPAGAFAQMMDAQVEGAKLCTKNLAHYEREYGIPSHLLSAISATESGRYHAGLKITLPWPWTINVEGQGHYYDSKAEAIAAVRKFQGQGARSIDVGCMQVNLIHHPDAFANLDDAFDPEKNVAYGASFLRNLYEENKSWKQASAHYHSRTPERGSEYVSRVYDRWTNIVSRLREAKANIPAETVAALADRELPARPVELVTASASQPKTIAVRPTARPAMRMNSISVTDVADGKDTRRDNGVLVIRPRITVANDAMPMRVVTASAAIPDMAPMAKVINVASVVPPELPKSGPRFIFEN
jgi:hypothetical protein